MNDSFALRKRSRHAPHQNQANVLEAFRGFEFNLAEHIAFLKAFLREPASVGALSPSSRALAKAMIQGFALHSADTVVEMGPGTGAFTGLIRERIGDGTTFITLELDPAYARRLKRRFPGLVVYNDSAERMREYLGLHGKHAADYIVSGLPWANLSAPTRSRIMQAILTSLAPDGVFTTFAYVHARWLPKAKQFRKTLERHFARVETSRVIWGNLPPAFVYRCTRPMLKTNGKLARAKVALARCYM